MKKIMTIFLSIIFVLALNSMIFAQNVPIDFESGGNGADWTWAVFENDTNPALEIIPNPDQGGANTSATVAQFTALQTGNPWAGCESQHGSDIGTFTLDETNCIVKIMVWKPVISDVGIKFALPDGGALPEIKVANTVINQWEELTFDFSGRIGEPATIGQDQIIIFPDFDLDGRTQDNICYFDNITFSEQGGGGEEPTAAAPTPTVPEGNVISLFSDVYTDVTVDTWRTDWSAATLEDVMIEGNAAKKYSALDFVGIETVGENSIDATEMTHVHLDVWSADFTFFGFKLVDFGGDNAFGGGDDVEHQINWEAPTQGEWISIDLPLTDFTGLTAREHLSQYILVGQPTGATTVYIDNFYFHNAPTAIEETNGTISSQFVLEQNYPNPFNPSTQIRFNLPQTNHVILTVYNMFGQEVMTLMNEVKQAGVHEVAFEAADLPSGAYIYSISAGKYQAAKKMLLIK